MLILPLKYFNVLVALSVAVCLLSYGASQSIDRVSSQLLSKKNKTTSSYSSNIDFKIKTKRERTVDLDALISVIANNKDEILFEIANNSSGQKSEYAKSTIVSQNIQLEQYESRLDSYEIGDIDYQETHVDNTYDFEEPTNRNGLDLHNSENSLNNASLHDLLNSNVVHLNKNLSMESKILLSNLSSNLDLTGKNSDIRAFNRNKMRNISPAKSTASLETVVRPNLVLYFL